ncbi:hypothetical protein BDQ17DRAFT_1350851 [Cyathus striatus]|nr:hypothetical protein BDQ17DRAFT_1350851 [Cyathus striatus]
MLKRSARPSSEASLPSPKRQKSMDTSPDDIFELSQDSTSLSPEDSMEFSQSQFQDSTQSDEELIPSDVLLPDWSFVFEDPKEEEHIATASQFMVDPSSVSGVLSQVLRDYKLADSSTKNYHINLPPSQPAAIDFGDLDLYRSKLPLRVVEEICEGLRRSILQFGVPESLLDNETAMWLFTAPLFRRLVYVFQGLIHDKPELIVNSSQLRGGKLLNRLEIFGSISMVILQMKLPIPGDSDRWIMHVLKQFKECANSNKRKAFKVPIIAVVADFTLLLVYKSANLISLKNTSSCTSEEFFVSATVYIELLYDLFTVSFVNSLKAFLEKSRVDAAKGRALKATGYLSDVHAAVNGEARAEEACNLMRQSLDEIPHELRADLGNLTLR